MFTGGLSAPNGVSLFLPSLSPPLPDSHKYAIRVSPPPDTLARTYTPLPHGAPNDLPSLPQPLSLHFCVFSAAQLVSAFVCSETMRFLSHGRDKHGEIHWELHNITLFLSCTIFPV